MNEPTIRPATHQDVRAVAALLSESHLPLAGVDEALRGFFVAESDAAIVGVAGVEPCGDNALLRSVAVASEWRGRGLGRKLVLRAIAQADEQGTRALYLLTTTAETYFPTFGFTATTRDAVPDDVRSTAEFREACPASAVVMVLRRNIP